MIIISTVYLIAYDCCYNIILLCYCNTVLIVITADIVDRVAPKFSELGVKYECLGGGRIKHNNDTKTIFVYGYSVVMNTCVCVRVCAALV